MRKFITIRENLCRIIPKKIWKVFRPIVNNILHYCTGVWFFGNNFRNKRHFGYFGPHCVHACIIIIMFVAAVAIIKILATKAKRSECENAIRWPGRACGLSKIDLDYFYRFTLQIAKWVSPILFLPGHIKKHIGQLKVNNLHISNV